MSYRFRHTIFFLILFAVLAVAHGQEVIYRNTLVYTQKDGLSSPNIHKIIQDKYGFLWIATQDGLNRFDGINFIQYNHDQNPERKLFSSDIRGLIPDNDNALLWVICNQGGINVINMTTGRCMQSYPYPAISFPGQWRICASRYKNKIFIGTSGGLEVFDVNTRTFNNTEIPAEQQAPVISGDIRTLTIGEGGLMALGLMNKGIFFYDLAKQSGFLIPAGGKATAEANDFWPLSGQFLNDSVFFCSTQNGLYVFNHLKRNITRADNGKFYHDIGPVTAILPYDRNQVVFAGNGLAVSDARFNISFYIRPNNTETEPWLRNITTIFRDEQKNIWIGARQGLCMLKEGDPVFRPVKNSSEKYDNKLGHVFSIGVADSNTILLGTKDGLFSLNRKNVLNQVYNNGLVQNITRIRKDVFIISGYRGSVLFNNGKIRPLSALFPELLPFQHWQFNSYVKLNDSVSLLGTESNNGILEWNTRRSRVTELTTRSAQPVKLPSDIVNSIYLDRKGRAFILSDYFISVYDGGKLKVHTLNNDTAGGIFMQMTETGSGYWIAAYGKGLIKTDHDLAVQKVYAAPDGLSNTGHYSIFNYRDSLLFLTSNYGISVLNPETGEFSNYFETDGLQNNTFEEASRDVYENEYYAGGADGFVKIYPGRLALNKVAPRVLFSRIVVDGSLNILLDTTDIKITGLRIPAQAVQVKVFLSAFNYQNPERVTYAYRLKEISSHWININAQGVISFIGLPPGTYHLQVKAYNEDGAESEVKELTLIFLPKWYQTWWFKLLLLLAFISLVYGLYRLRIGQLKKEEKIRNQLARDLHDDLGSTLNSIKVHSNLAIMERENTEHLEHVKQGAQEAISGVRDIIWVLDDKKDSLQDMLNRVTQFAQPLCTANKILYTLETGDDANEIKLGKEEKRNLYLIIKETINNSLKYAGCRNITLKAESSNKRIRFEITDDGNGFDITQTSAGYGLRNIASRAETIGYSSTLTTAPGQGVRLVLEKN